MDTLHALYQPKKLEKQLALKIAKKATSSKEAFKNLLRGVGEKDPQMAGRAAWCFSLAAEIKRDWANEYQGEVVAMLTLKSPPDMILRNLLRVLRSCNIDPRHFDCLTFYCFEWLEDLRQSIAIRAFALHILGQICMGMPEIKPELKAIIEFYFMDENKKVSAGLSAAAKRVYQLCKD